MPYFDHDNNTGSSKWSGSRSTGRRYEGSSHGDDLELPIFDLGTIAAATDGFSINNKLGEGGFGPVYKVPPTLYNLHGQSQICIVMLTFLLTRKRIFNRFSTKFMIQSNKTKKKLIILLA
jgi:hypothetical protein